MIDAWIEELMWLEIDQKISPSEHERLQAHLKTRPTDREHFAALQRMAQLFGQMGEVDPPAELHERIIHALETAKPPRSHRAHLFARAGAGEERAGFIGRLTALFTPLTPRPAWTLAAAAVAGVFIGVIGYHLIRSGAGTTGDADNARFYGTVNKDGLGRDGAVLHIDVEGATGELRARRDDSRVFSELDIRSEKEIEIILEYGGTPLDVAAGKRSGYPPNEVAAGDGEVRVRNRGDGTYRFSFALAEDPASPMTVSVRSEQGEVLYQGKVLPPAAPARQ